MKLFFRIAIILVMMQTYSQSKYFTGEPVLDTIYAGDKLNNISPCVIQNKEDFKLVGLKKIAITDLNICVFDTVYTIFHDSKKLYTSSLNLKVKQKDILYFKDKSKKTLDSLAVIYDDINRKNLELLNKKNKEKEVNNTIKILNELTNAKKEGVLVKSFYPTNNYDLFSGVYIEFINLSRKKIKYAYFTFNSYNSVNDYISTKTVTCIGFIEPEKLASYDFKNIWKTNLVNSIKLTKVKIQYSDGSIKLITNLKNIIASSLTSEYLDAN